MQPCFQLLLKQLPFPSLPDGFKRCLRGSGRDEQWLQGLPSRAIQPQATYIDQPGVRVLDGYVQHTAGLLLVIYAGVSQGFDDHQEDVCPLRGLEVFSKVLREEGTEDTSHQVP